MYQSPWSPALINLASTLHVKNITLIFHIQKKNLNLINPVVRHWSYTCHSSQWQSSPVDYDVEFPMKLTPSFSIFFMYIRCNYLLQSCLTLYDPMDCKPPGSSVCGILQARILEWFYMPFSKWSSWSRDRICLLHLLHWQVGSLPLGPPWRYTLVTKIFRYTAASKYT